MLSRIYRWPVSNLALACLLTLGVSCGGSGSSSSSSASAEDVVADLAGLQVDVLTDLAHSTPAGVAIPEVIPGIPMSPIPPEEEKRREEDLRRFGQAFAVAEPEAPGVPEPPYRVIGLGAGQCTSISPDGLLVAGTTDESGLRPFVVGANGLRRELPLPDGFRISVVSRHHGVSVPRVVEGGGLIGLGGQDVDADVLFPELAPTRALAHGVDGWEVLLPAEVAVVHGMNARGVLVGARAVRDLSMDDLPSMVAIVRDDGGLRDLPSLGGTWAMAAGVNGRCVITATRATPHKDALAAQTSMSPSW